MHGDAQVTQNIIQKYGAAQNGRENEQLLSEVLCYSSFWPIPTLKHTRLPYILILIALRNKHILVVLVNVLTFSGTNIFFAFCIVYYSQTSSIFRSGCFQSGYFHCAHSQCRWQ